MKKQRQTLFTDERGQSPVLEWLLLTLLLVLMLGMATFLVKVRPAQVSVAAAARTCARQAGVTLNQTRGLEQARVSALAVLASGHLDPARAEVQVVPLGSWDRFSQAQCTVLYTVNLHAVPFLRLFAPGPNLTLQASYTTSIDPHKSRWEAGP